MVANKDDTNEVDLAVGGISETGAHYAASGPEGRYTITEAAQLKGVSYHTVSRAIRRGRLPVQRLGRMALISYDDLAAWRPMREKAPRKYRQSEDATEAPLSQLAVNQAAPLSLATQLSSYYEDIHLAASESSFAEFVTLVCERFAEALGLSRVSFWAIDEQSNSATRIAAIGDDFDPFPASFALSDIPFVATFARSSNARIVLDLQAELGSTDDQVRADGAESLFAAPLRVRSRPVGLLCGDRSGAGIDLTQEQLALAQRFANQAALALEYNRVLRNEARQAGQLKSVVDEVDAAVCACDADGRMTVINASHRQLAGYSEQEADDLLGLEARAYLSLNADRRFRLDGTPFPIEEHPLMRAINGEHTQDVEYSIIVEGRDPIYINSSGSPIEINGEFLGAVSTGREQTRERRELEHEREERQEVSDELARTTVLAIASAELQQARTSSDVIRIALDVLLDEVGAETGSLFRIERGGKLRFVAQQGTDERDEGSVVYDVIALPNTATALASGVPSLVRRDAASSVEARAISGSGDTSVLIVPMLHKGMSQGVMYANFRKPRVLVAEDYEFCQRLSELVGSSLVRVAEFDSLQAQMNRVLGVIDQLPQALLVISYPTGEIQIANQAAEAMWGIPLRDPLLRAENLAVIDIEGRRGDRDHHPLLRSLHTGEDYLGEPLTVERSDGTLVEVLANHTPILDASGLILGSVSVLQDRSNFKPLDRAKDEFLSVVAHEIRNPLTSLRGNLQLLERRIRRGQREDIDGEIKRVRSVIDQVDRIAELVSRMLDISRADLGKLDLSLGETDASALLQSVVTEVGGVQPMRDILVTAPEQLTVTWDEVRVQQILVNLITNAMRYAPDGPIEVTLVQPDVDTVSIAVRDHGHGVPPRIRKRLFNQYYRFDDGQEDREPALDGSRGLGIGLYISARLAREHGGRLEVGDAVDGGAVFTLILPKKAEIAQPVVAR